MGFPDLTAAIKHVSQQTINRDARISYPPLTRLVILGLRLKVCGRALLVTTPAVARFIAGSARRRSVNGAQCKWGAAATL